jgi:adenylosuccinate synthase
LNDEKTVNDFVKVNCKLFNKLNLEEILKDIKQEKDLLLKLIKDEYILIDHNNLLLAQERKNNKRILVEASQSSMLSIDGGMYPFCTSSDTSVNGILS